MLTNSKTKKDLCKNIYPLSMGPFNTWKQSLLYMLYTLLQKIKHCAICSQILRKHFFILIHNQLIILYTNVSDMSKVFITINTSNITVLTLILNNERKNNFLSAGCWKHRKSRLTQLLQIKITVTWKLSIWIALLLTMALCTN